MKKLLIVEQTLLVNTFEYVQRTVWRICIVMLEQKGSRTPHHWVIWYCPGPLFLSLHLCLCFQYRTTNDNFIMTSKISLLMLLANFKKVSQLASSSPIIHPTVDLVNENLSHLVDTHPVLVLQWCHVLRQLKYTDTQFWFGFLDTGLRLSTGRKSRKLHCFSPSTS